MLFQKKIVYLLIDVELEMTSELANMKSRVAPDSAGIESTATCVLAVKLLDGPTPDTCIELPMSSSISVSSGVEAADGITPSIPDAVDPFRVEIESKGRTLSGFPYPLIRQRRTKMWRNSRPAPVTVFDRHSSLGRARVESQSAEKPSVIQRPSVLG